MKFSYTLLKDWQGVAEMADNTLIRSLTAQHRLLLVSDSSLTLDLELLFGSKAGVEVRLKGLAALNSEEALFLDADLNATAMEREVWLTVEGRRLVYAHSLIPVDCIDEELMNTLKRLADEPLGRVLQAERVPFAKDRLELGLVRCERVAADLNIDGQTPFIARRYRLLNRDSSRGWIIKAAVTEVFSPEIIPCKEGAFCPG